MTDVATGQFILGCWAAFLVFWLISSFRVKQTESSESWLGQSVWSRVILIVGVALVLQVNSGWFTGRGLWPYSPAVGVIADCLAGFGLFVLLWARVTLGGNWSAGVVLKKEHELVRRGPYAYVRHPIYSGILLLFFGEAVWFGSIGWFAVFGLFGTVLWLKSRQEERLMMKHFPHDYAEYRRTTKALVPFVF